MKKIAIFCDGTWNTPQSQTNVHKLFKSTRLRPGTEPGATPDAAPLEPGQTDQIRDYFYGVGTDEENDISWWDKVTCGAFGKGLDGIVSRAYVSICTHYEPGDQLFIFGFSRGAYTARSLIGLMRTCGIVDKSRASFNADVTEAMQIYRKRNSDTGPDFPPAVKFRKTEGKACAWVDGESTGRTERLHGPLDPRGCLRFRYLGVWDTVGALGIPEKLPFSRHVNTKYRFHDCNLSSTVEYARHAVAIDEYRHAFEPTLWSCKSIEEVNRMHKPEFRVEQDWFPGDHGSVGGGGDYTALSDAALDWIAQGAEAAGLLFDRAPGSALHAATHKDLAQSPSLGPVFGPLRNTEDKPNPLMHLRGRGGRSPLDAKTGDARCVLGHAADLSPGALERMRRNAAYLTPQADDDNEARKTRGYRLRTLSQVVGKV